MSDIEVAEETTTPIPLMAGTFALYETPHGGIVLVTDVAGRGVERREFPPALVKMATGGGGFMGSKLRGMFGGQ
jgi:hypothetical protein